LLGIESVFVLWLKTIRLLLINETIIPIAGAIRDAAAAFSNLYIFINAESAKK
jgi:hypothetical protein